MREAAIRRDHRSFCFCHPGWRGGGGEGDPMAKNSGRRGSPRPLDQTLTSRHISDPGPRRRFRLKELTLAHRKLSKRIHASLKGVDRRGGRATLHLGDALDRLTMSMDRITHWCELDPSRLAIGLAALVSATAFLEHVMEHRVSVRNPGYPVDIAGKRRARVGDETPDP
jgi:hypothetical protein